MSKPTWAEVSPDLVAAYLGTYPGLRHGNNHLAAKDATAYTPEEVAAILAAACDRAGPILALIAFTGIRTAESLS